MAKARVQLRHCESHTGMTGSAWIKNQSRVLTNASQIDYYKSQTEFVVTMLEEPKSKPKQAKPATSSGEGDDNAGGDGLSKAKLMRMSNAELVDFAAEKYQLALDEDEMKKSDLVAAILEAQG